VPALRLSPRLQPADWPAAARLRADSRARRVEGLMLKRHDARYGVGRTRDVGIWWKWKIEPMAVDAVLVYAQRGHGRRASLYTDYTFAVWDRAPRDAAEAQRVVAAIAAGAPKQAAAKTTAEAKAEAKGQTKGQTKTETETETETEREADREADRETERETERGTKREAETETETEPGELPRLVPFAKAYSGLTDAEIRAVDAVIRRTTIEQFGPVRSVVPTLLFELGFEGIQRSPRHRSGIAVRFPRMLRQRPDKPLHEADTLQTLQRLLAATEP
jgi:DNA ligase-1